jgi:hypothetical protein
VARLLGVAIDPPASPPLALPAGQVLTLVGTGAAQRWAPAAIPAAAPLAVTLGGDATGAATANTVTRIRGVTVSATAPTDRQILRCALVGGQPQWVPEAFPPPTPVTLSGDVTNPAAAGAVQVVGLRGIGLASTPPVGGQVLQFQSATNVLQWVTLPAPPAPNLTQVVRHPVPTGRYEIVAAGSFEFDFNANPQTLRILGPTTFNGLAPLAAARPSLRFRFDSCQASDNETPRFIIKLTPWGPVAGNPDLTFLTHLVQFVSGGFEVGIRFQQTEVPRATGRLQVEISQYVF